MNRNQVKGHANEAKVKEVAGKVTDDKSAKYETKAFMGSDQCNPLNKR